MWKQTNCSASSRIRQIKSCYLKEGKRLRDRLDQPIVQTTNVHENKVLQTQCKQYQAQLAETKQRLQNLQGNMEKEEQSRETRLAVVKEELRKAQSEVLTPGSWSCLLWYDLLIKMPHIHLEV